MFTIYQLKSRFQNLLRPACRWLAAAGITANQVTVLATVISAATGLLVTLNPAVKGVLLLVPGVLLGRMALNAIDGMLAREYGQQSHLGAVLNELGDVLSDVALYLPFALIPGVPSGLVVGVVLLGLLVEMTGVIAVQIGATRRYDGPLGKSDRAFLFGLIALVLGLGISPGLWLSILLAAAVVLSLVTIVNRARAALQEVGP